MWSRRERWHVLSLNMTVMQWCCKGSSKAAGEWSGCRRMLMYRGTYVWHMGYSVHTGAAVCPGASFQAWCLHVETKCPLGRCCGWIAALLFLNTGISGWISLCSSQVKLFKVICNSFLPFLETSVKFKEALLPALGNTAFPCWACSLKADWCDSISAVTAGEDWWRRDHLQPFSLHLLNWLKHKCGFLCLAWLCQVSSWLGTLVGGKVSGAWATPGSQLGLWADVPWRQRHLVTHLQTCTSLGEQDALIIFIVSLAKHKLLGLNYRVLDCKSLSSLTLPLQMCGGCLPEQGLGGGTLCLRLPAVVLVQIALLLRVFNQFASI